MYKSFNIKLFGLVLCMSISLGYAGFSQNSSLEFWPETDLYYKVSPSWRFSTFIPITKYYESKERDLNVYLQTDYAWGKTKKPVARRLMDENRIQQIKAWMFRTGYMQGWSLQDLGESYSEDMAFAELHKRIPLLGSLLLSQRIRNDHRWVGQEHDYSYRIRFRVMLEKDFTFQRSSLVPFVNIEPYWDLRYEEFNRFRAIAGATYSWNTGYALEGNLTYQYDTKYYATHVYAINIILHIYFESKNVRQSITS